MFQGFCVQIFRAEHQLPGIEKFRTEDSEDKLLKGHAVVGKKAAQSEGERRQHTQPADVSLARHGPEPKVHAHRHDDGQQGENELPQGESEKQALLVVADFFVDADFDDNSLPFNQLIFIFACIIM